MTPKYTFSRFAYFDTGIISHLAKNRHLWPKLLNYLTDNDLTMGIGGPQLVELSDARSLHQALAELFVSVPSVTLKNWDVVINEEVKAHPKRRKDTIRDYPLNRLLFESDGIEGLVAFLGSKELGEARKDQKRLAKEMKSRHEKLKQNFPPSKTGNYIREQADEFAMIEVMQWLTSSHRDFLLSFQNKIDQFNPEVFLSIRLFAQVIYYKYYLGRREPNKLSDFGDLAHLMLIPYCELAVMERDLCNVLNQIKRHQDTLSSTTIHDIDFFKDWD